MNGIELIDVNIQAYRPAAVYVLFSGGHDSLTAAHIAMQHPSVRSAVHINTGTGIKQTRDFVIETCDRMGWPLIEIRAKEDCGQDYRKIVLEHGFPGPFAHFQMYAQLKERAIRKLVREAKTNWRDKVMLITGVRTQESIRRMRHVDPVQIEGAKVWVAPIHDWSKIETNEYIDEQGLERNAVVDLIHMSGECLCGAFAKPGELKEIEAWFPDTAARLKDLETEVRDRGHDWGWEEKPPTTRKRRPDKNQPMLCFSCVHDAA